MSNGTLAELYTSDIKKSLDKWSPWQPNEKYSLGDIGICHGDRFEKLTSFKDLPIKADFESEIAVEKTKLYSYMSKEGTSFSFGANASVNPNVPATSLSAKAELEFSKAGSFYFVVRDYYEERVKDLYILKNCILQLYGSYIWEKEWAIITQIMHAENGTFFISESKNSKMTFSVKGNVKGSVLDFGDANAGISLEHQTGKILKIEDSPNITPTFKLARIQSRPFKDDIVTTMLGLEGDVDPIDFITPEAIRKYPGIKERLVLEEFI